MGDIADLPAVRTQTDVLDRWRLMMGPGGFGRRSLWVVWFDAQGVQGPVVVPVDDIPLEPDDETVSAIVGLARGVLDEHAPGGSVSLALSRPGPTSTRPADRAWARSLVRCAEAARLPLRCVHLATCDSVHQFTLDDVL